MNRLPMLTAYFQGVDGWQAYELNSIDRIVYLDIVKDGVVVDWHQRLYEI